MLAILYAHGHSVQAGRAVHRDRACTQGYFVQPDRAPSTCDGPATRRQCRTMSFNARPETVPRYTRHFYLKPEAAEATGESTRMWVDERNCVTCVSIDTPHKKNLLTIYSVVDDPFSFCGRRWWKYFVMISHSGWLWVLKAPCDLWLIHCDWSIDAYFLILGGSGCKRHLVHCDWSIVTDPLTIIFSFWVALGAKGTLWLVTDPLTLIFSFWVALGAKGTLWLVTDPLTLPQIKPFHDSTWLPVFVESFWFCVDFVVFNITPGL